MGGAGRRAAAAARPSQGARRRLFFFLRQVRIGTRELMGEHGVTLSPDEERRVQVSGVRVE